MLELFPLKVFALLVCRGTPHTKAGILFDLVTGKKEDSTEESSADHDQIAWGSIKLDAAIKLIFYFSEILPKKFIYHYRSERAAFELFLEDRSVERIRGADVDKIALCTQKLNEVLVKPEW